MFAKRSERDVCAWPVALLALNKLAADDEDDLAQFPVLVDVGPLRAWFDFDHPRAYAVSAGKIASIAARADNDIGYRRNLCYMRRVRPGC